VPTSCFVQYHEVLEHDIREVPKEGDVSIEQEQPRALPEGSPPNHLKLGREGQGMVVEQNRNRKDLRAVIEKAVMARAQST
jgi:hypothetical protein